jgi:phospholipid-transporting ATPase
LLRGSSLRNTEWIWGVVTHTGHDTRIMRNSVKSRPKSSQLENKTGRQIVYIFLLQCALCMTASLYSTFWLVNNEIGTNTYLDLLSARVEEASAGLIAPPWSGKDLSLAICKGFFSWILLFTNMVPISLLVTLELVKYF